MSQVSKYPLRPQVEERILAVFWKVIADLSSPTNVEFFFNSLLSRSEKIMLSKRLAIAILLSKNYTYTEISDLLKVSVSTIGYVKDWLDIKNSVLQQAINNLLKQEQQQEFWDNLEEFLSTIIVPRKGSNWSKARSEQMQKIKLRRIRRSIL
jgi:uncharacterized protein YerC